MPGNQADGGGQGAAERLMEAEGPRDRARKLPELACWPRCKFLLFSCISAEVSKFRSLCAQ